MRNKKAWLRIVEATIGVLIVASVLFIMIVRTPRQGESSIPEIQRFILEQISKNQTLRGQILNDNLAGTNDYINSVLPPNLGFQARICEVEKVCGIEQFTPDLAEKVARKEVYGDEIFISSTLQEYKPKKLKLFVWIN